MKCITAFIFTFLSCYASAQPMHLQNVAGRKSLSLNGNWNYIIDPYEMGYYDYRREPFDQSASGKGGFYDDRPQKDKSELIEYDFNFSPVHKIPADWNSQTERLFLYEGTVWYRRKFTSTPQAGKNYVLYFAAVNYEAHVYLNGKKLGIHKGGFTPFEFDVTALLKDGENVVVVKADNTRRQDEIPTINTDWWNYGGITRDVLLIELPQTYIADYRVQMSPSASGMLEGWVQMRGPAASQKLALTIPGAKISIPLQTNDSGLARFTLPAKKLRLWSPEDPYLYVVNIAGATDTLQDKIGFRTISTKGADIILNGKPVFLRGICLHDENPLIPGRLRSEGDIRMMLQWAKELNCNYVRLAHYPHNEKMLRLADEMGLMVWAEVPVYWTISWKNAATFANATRQLTDMILRDKNRASVIIWSVGNETPLSNERFDFMSGLVKTARSLDSTRLVAAALEVHRKGNEVVVDDRLGELLDLVSFNQYAAWYWGGTPKELGKYHFNIKYNKPVVISEFGGGALQGFHGDADTRWSEEYQAALFEANIKMLQTIPNLRGTTPWILADFKSPRRQHPFFQDFWNRKGLISNTGIKKQAFFVVKAFYDKMEFKYK